MAYCFAWDQNNRGVWGCKVLRADCDGTNEGCGFFKTMEQHMEDKKAADERLAGLPDWQQEAIAEKYYDGERPWKQKAPTLDSIINNAVEQMVQS